jgi:hypothetical protein
MGGHKQELWEKRQDISCKGILEGTWGGGGGYMEIKERINGGKWEKIDMQGIEEV